MNAISDMEFCGIIEAACPYDHGCSVCRLHNDYETALEKSLKLVGKYRFVATSQQNTIWQQA